jgi:hypothetical protein
MRRTQFVFTACAATAAVVLGAADRALSATGLRQAAATGVVANCSTRSLARFPDAFTSPRNLVVGPLALVGAGGTPAFTPFSSGVGGNKFPLLVRAGHRVTIELSTATRKAAGLAYGPLPQGYIHLSDTHRVVTFIACPPGTPASSAVTFWSGGVLARSPRCVPLQVWIDAASTPRYIVFHLGVRRCT